MTSQTQMSSKGQVVVPKAIRERLGWRQGVRIEVVERPGGVMLRSVAEQPGSTAEEALDRIWARSPYRGPTITDEEMHRAVLEVAAEQDLRSRW